ncbi:MAG TPA: OmpH family outer membrane protein [Candidatus Eisenbacteria bacterium]|jgi:Skp family chaperone for outer membrane proteins
MRLDRSTVPLWIAVTALLLAAASGRAASLRIGFIDSAKIFQGYRVAQEAQQQFDRQVQTWRAEAGEKENLVTKLRAELRDQGPILSALRRQEKEEGLQKAVGEYEKFVQDIWGPQGRAVQENERTTREVVNQIRAVVEKLAVEKGLEMVFDAAGGTIIYADRGLDLSADVVKELNARSPGAGAH